MTKAIYPGSFDPITKGHTDIIQRSGERFEKLIIGVGNNSDKNYMFSFPEKVEMIHGAVKESVDKNINTEILPYSGLLTDFAFHRGVNTVIRGIRGPEDFDPENKLNRVLREEGIESFSLFAKYDQTHISSSMSKVLLKEQSFIQEYVSLNVKHFMEARMMGQYIVGVTGTIGSGKSFISSRFEELGKQNNIPVHNIDLDKIGHYILGEATDQGNKNIRQELANKFGDKIIGDNGFINRKKLGSIVFNSPEKRKVLDEILEKAILIKIREEIKGKKGIILLNGALLAEGGYTDLVNNNIVLIGVNEKIQKLRLIARGHNNEEIKRRIESQFSTDNKKTVISNNINSKQYGEITEFENKGNNSIDLEKSFNEMICNIDIYGELRIKSILTKLGLEDKWLELYSKVKPLHDSPERLHHNWFHIVSCLNELYEIKGKLNESDFNSLFLAFLFHDSIYDSKAKSGENENNSSILSEEVLKNIGVKKDIIDKVKHLIGLTASHDYEGENDIGKYMIDIDMSVLGSDLAEYIKYSKSIRYEYSNYNDEDYKKGRLNFLEKTLKKQIFKSEYFHEKYEEKAKINMQREEILLRS